MIKGLSTVFSDLDLGTSSEYDIEYVRANTVKAADSNRAACEKHDGDHKHRNTEPVCTDVIRRSADLLCLQS